MALAQDLRNTVVITLGAEGRSAREVTRSCPSRHCLRGLSIQRRFVGALTSALSRGDTMEAAMRRAAVARSLACMIVGASRVSQRASKLMRLFLQANTHKSRTENNQAAQKAISDWVHPDRIARSRKIWRTA